MRFVNKMPVACFLVSVLSTPAFAMSESFAPPEKVLVAGSTGETGLEVVKLLRANGAEVVGFARESSDKAPLEELGVEIAVGDAFDKSSIDDVLSGGGYTAVVSTLGSGFRDRKRVDFEGNRNLIDSAKNAGVDRFVLVTMIGIGDSSQAVPDNVKRMFSEVIELKTLAEDYLKESGLSYTILRPGGLLSKPATGNGIRSQDPMTMGTIHRADLARLVVDALADDTQIGETYSVVDANILGVPDNEFIRTGRPPEERE